MKENLKIYNKWNKTLLCHKQLKLEEAQRLYLEITRTEDSKIKNEKFSELLMGTLYVVSNYIKNSKLLYLNSPIYDMDDIISTITEGWVYKMNKGKILEVNRFIDMFDSEFLKIIYDGLKIKKIAILEDTIISATTFAEFFLDYIELKEKYPNLATIKFKEHVKENYKNILSLLDASFDTNNIDICNIFEAILTSFRLKGIDSIFVEKISGLRYMFLITNQGECVRLSSNKINKLKYILINNGLEYLKQDLSTFTLDSYESEYLENLRYEEIRNVILESPKFNDRAKKILFERYGIFDDKPKTLEYIGKQCGLSKNRIRSIEAKTLQLLRQDSRYLDKFKNIMH